MLFVKHKTYRSKNDCEDEQGVSNLDMFDVIQYGLSLPTDKHISVFLDAFPNTFQNHFLVVCCRVLFTLCRCRSSTSAPLSTTQGKSA